MMQKLQYKSTAVVCSIAKQKQEEGNRIAKECFQIRPGEVPFQ